MGEQEKRKSGGSKLTRSETVTVRLDPKLRYLAELAARKQRRTLSSFIEWAVEDSLSRVVIQELDGATIADQAANLWDVDESDRFAKLALRYPYLLTHEEQIVWKLIQENGHFWLGRYAGPEDEWTWRVDEQTLIFDRLREYWNKFIAVAQGKADKSTLPSWRKGKQDTGKGAFDDLEDDFPSDGGDHG